MHAPVHPENCPAAGEIKMVSPASSVILPHLRFPRAPWLPAAKRIRLHLVNISLTKTPSCIAETL
jgi:hypothetical protein